jgi:hypothetical protein
MTYRSLKRRGGVLASAALLLTLASGARAETLYGITDAFTLFSFDSATPATITNIGTLSGVVGGQTIRAIDFRPANGQLYALSTLTGGGAAQLYTVNLSNASLTAVGSGLTLTGNANARVSIDFNPVVDRLRVITGTGLNYRVNPDTGALVLQDTSLVYDPTSSSFAGTTPFMGDVAYSNNVAGASSSTMYTIDYTNAFLSTVGGVGGTPSPNTGATFAVGANGVQATNASLGFDISGATGVGYVSLNPQGGNGFDSLYTINLGTGALTSTGSFNANVLDISVRSTAVAPEPGALALALPVLGAFGIAARRKKMTA